MIPPMVPADYASAGEREVFRRLQGDPGTRDWIVLHSLALATHQRRVSGEIDFVVIIPGCGIVALEVKGCSTTALRRVDGLWYYGQGGSGDSRGPFRQASEGMHTLRRRVAAAFPRLRAMLFASAVLFPFALFSEKIS